eukprot:scaffold63922_cov36-Cyclotella_meneghiniana.AAC.1
MYLPVDLHEILTETASVVAIAVWLRFPLGEVAIQFDGRNGHDLTCGEPNVVIEEECGRQSMFTV